MEFKAAVPIGLALGCEILVISRKNPNYHRTSKLLREEI
jgi:hypothetical protein